MTKYEEFRFFDMCQVFSFSLGLSGHFLLIYKAEFPLINFKSKLTQDTLHRKVNTDLSKYINLRRSN